MQWASDGPAGSYTLFTVIVCYRLFALMVLNHAVFVSCLEFVIKDFGLAALGNGKKAHRL
jgi:hypothetical protein